MMILLRRVVGEPKPLSLQFDVMCTCDKRVSVVRARFRYQKDARLSFDSHHFRVSSPEPEHQTIFVEGNFLAESTLTQNKSGKAVSLGRGPYADVHLALTGISKSGEQLGSLHVAIEMRGSTSAKNGLPSKGSLHLDDPLEKLKTIPARCSELIQNTLQLTAPPKFRDLAGQDATLVRGCMTEENAQNHPHIIDEAGMARLIAVINAAISENRQEIEFELVVARHVNPTIHTKCLEFDIFPVQATPEISAELSPMSVFSRSSEGETTVQCTLEHASNSISSSPFSESSESFPISSPGSDNTTLPWPWSSELSRQNDDQVTNSFLRPSSEFDLSLPPPDDGDEDQHMAELLAQGTFAPTQNSNSFVQTTPPWLRGQSTPVPGHSNDSFSFDNSSVSRYSDATTQRRSTVQDTAFPEQSGAFVSSSSESSSQPSGMESWGDDPKQTESTSMPSSSSDNAAQSSATEARTQDYYKSLAALPDLDMSFEMEPPRKKIRQARQSAMYTFRGSEGSGCLAGLIARFKTMLVNAFI
eukprot:c15944_g1_i1.p1 GENE.c15944_g1_i1~~c15944_g1_i1.p1  ORF type:complete len:529 (-),score=91.33 c15944_g1_i1:99-1685(-)